MQLKLATTNVLLPAKAESLELRAQQVALVHMHEQALAKNAAAQYEEVEQLRSSHQSLLEDERLASR